MKYFVYVIELDKEVINSKKFRSKNPKLNKRKKCFYVGQSANFPEIRFIQHKKGYKSNSFARRFGICLSPRKYRKYNPIETREKAEEIEKKLTEKLRKKGHGVWSN
jgi:hypothetical protein